MIYDMIYLLTAIWLTLGGIHMHIKNYLPRMVFSTLYNLNLIKDRQCW